MLLCLSAQAMARRKAFLAPPYHTGIDGVVAKMNAVFDDVENLARTQIPLPYAQIARFVSFLFLAPRRLSHMREPLQPLCICSLCPCVEAGRPRAGAAAQKGEGPHTQ